MKTSLVVKAVLAAGAVLLLSACSSSTPPKPDYRVEAQKQGADKAQQELSREMKKTY